MKEMQDTLLKIKTDPLAFLKAVVYKTLIAPIVYGRGNDYDAGKYWSDRFSKYGHSLKGVGNEALSEQDNQKSYTAAAQIFIDLCTKEGVDFNNARVLEIGCGTGFYTRILHDLGVKHYVGVDITDVLFSDLQQKFPDFQFMQKDVTADKITGEFDLIVMIDVIEHIVNNDKFTSAMENIKGCLAKSGVFIVAPLVQKQWRKLFYVTLWSFDDMKARFPGYHFGEPVLFRDGNIVAIRGK